jgi:hypothetical protein
MKTVKIAVVSLAGGLLLAAGDARAADFPLKAKAVEYVRVCSLYGAGFYYIPGTDTCIKLGGYLRVDVLANSNAVDTGNESGPGGANNRFTNGYTWRSREDLNIDTRTATEYGVLRTYFDARFTWTGGSYAGTGLGGTTYSGDAVAGGSLGVYYAFIQFAGFTIGKAVSEFSTPWHNYPGNNFDGLVGGGGSDSGVSQFTYTAEFGQGISAAISVQDPTAYYQAGVNNLGVPGTFGYGTSDYGGTSVPDIVARLRVDQAWGIFQASAAAHNNHAAYYGGGGESSGHPDDAWGWAGQVGLSIKNIPTGPGDKINVEGVYTNGATRYNIQDLATAAGAATVYGHSSVAYQSVGFGFAPDTVFGPGGSQQLVQTWGMRGAYTHNWNPAWDSSIYGAYASIRYTEEAKSLMCGAGGSVLVRLSAGSTCNPDYNIAELGLITRWTPVKNMVFSADFTWIHLDQKYAGLFDAASAAVGQPSASYELRNQNTFMVLLRAQRNW